MTQAKFHQVETAKRIRTLSTEIKRINGLPINAHVEVGLRTHPMACAWMPIRLSEAIHPDDDLAESVDIQTAVQESQVCSYGSVVHIYVWTRNSINSDLADVRTCWMGTATEGPSIL